MTDEERSEANGGATNHRKLALQILNEIWDRYSAKLTELELSDEAEAMFREMVYLAAINGTVRGSAETSGDINEAWAKVTLEERLTCAHSGVLVDLRMHENDEGDF